MRGRMLVTCKEFLGACEKEKIKGTETCVGQAGTTAMIYELENGRIICINHVDCDKMPVRIVDKEGKHLAYVDETDMLNFIEGSRKFENGYIRKV